MEVSLGYNKKFNWINKEKIYVIGYIIKEGNFLIGEDLINYFGNIIREENIINELNNIDGRFTIIMEQRKNIIIVSDILRSFPVFYKIKKDKIIISDSIDYFEKSVLKEESCLELMAAGYVTGKDTLYKDVYQNEAAKVITINKEDYKISAKKYFEFRQDEHVLKEEESQVYKKLDELYNNSIKTLIKYANGRKIVLPLSRRT